jgi:hypothetical protein
VLKEILGLGNCVGTFERLKESVMKRELTSVVCLCLMLLLLTAIAPAQQKSAVEMSYAQAREVLPPFYSVERNVHEKNLNHIYPNDCRIRSGPRAGVR